LAAIVIPQFIEASNDARASAQASDLQTLRGQIDLFRMQHVGSYPTVINGGPTCQLTNATTMAGLVSTTGTLGPYLQDIPANPYQPATTAQHIDLTWNGTTTPGSASGWYYHTTTGRVEAGVAP
jgi:general secretion pathway protein G